MSKLPRPTPEEIESLRQTIAEAQAAGVSLAEAQARRLALCLKVGETLNQWRPAFPTGSWQPFLASTFAEIPYRTIHRWCDLALKVAAGKIDIGACYSIKEAFSLCDMMPARNAPSPRRQEPKQKRLAHSYLLHATRLLAALRELKTDRMGTDDKREVRRRLKPIVEFYESLAAPQQKLKLAA